MHVIETRFERTMSGKFDPLSAPLPLRNPSLRAPLTLRRFSAPPLTAPLPLTRFPGRSAPFSAPLTLRSHAHPEWTRWDFYTALELDELFF